jgi:hypothetical protein
VKASDCGAGEGASGKRGRAQSTRPKEEGLLEPFLSVGKFLIFSSSGNKSPIFISYSTFNFLRSSPLTVFKARKEIEMGF